jgi:hypothetical protein
MIEIFNGIWTLEHVNNNPDKIFVFNDNNFKMGKYGLSVIRDLPNAIGIRVKKGPSKKPVSYYTDFEFNDNILNIDLDILAIKKKLLSGKTIVFSSYGYGYPTPSPKTYDYLCDSLRLHFNFNNKTGTKFVKIPGYDEISGGIYVSLSKREPFKDGLVQPVNNSFFREEFLVSGIFTISDLIKTLNKTTFTQNIKYKSGDILIFSFSDTSEYLVCRVVQSYCLKAISKEDWSFFECYNSEFVDSINLYNDNNTLNQYFQTHFQYICSLDQTGKMIFRDDIFGASKDIEENFDKSDKDVSDNSDKINKSFFRKDLNTLLSNKKINGSIELVDTEFPKGEVYRITSDVYNYFILFKKGLFFNSIKVILKMENEK